MSNAFAVPLLVVIAWVLFNAAAGILVLVDLLINRRWYQLFTPPKF